jgi:CRISPR-associated protein Cas1
MYKITAARFDIQWNGRRYDRDNPTAADLPDQAINHVASAVEGAAAIAVAATATIPQLGFVHENSGQSFVLDIADLHRDGLTVPAAFRAVKAARANPEIGIERAARRIIGAALRREGVIAAMIDQIKALLEDDGAPARS